MYFINNLNGRKPKHWYENSKHPLTIALIGSFIAAFAIIVSTLLIIHFGPNSQCDFSLESDHTADTINLNDIDETRNIDLKINVTDMHPQIKPYNQGVYVKVVGTIPKGTGVNLQNKAGKLPLNINA